jgi:hypothetical protein
MATSNSTNFTLNRDQIIRQALLNLRKTDPALTVDAQDITDGATALNLLIKGWQTDGLFLWLNQEVCLHLAYNTKSYLLGPSGDNCATTSDAAYTQLGGDEALGQTVLTVDSISGITDGDFIGIELDTGTIQWTTVNGVPAETDVTVTDALTGAASEDNYVFHYTSKISRPTMILEARLRDVDEVDVPLQVHSSRNDFFQITDKTTTGTTLEVYYEPLITNGRLYVWPVAGTVDITDRIIMTVQRVIEDFDSSADNFDGPVEALPALIWGLSAYLAPMYGVDITMGKGALIGAAAQGYYSKLKSHYTDREPVYITI